MKHFLGDLDVEAISKGEHPDFSMVGKIEMIIRGALNKKLAEGLRYTTQQNKWLTQHYYNFPDSPDGFGLWKGKLQQKLDEANTKLASFAN